MASRSVHIDFENDSGFTLTRVSESLEHGVWSDGEEAPPRMGADGTSSWRSESDGFATGTEGHAVYSIDGIAGGEVRLHWNNPFVGTNNYDHSVTPQWGDMQLDGFSIVRTGGHGDNAIARFHFARGGLQVEADGSITGIDAEASTSQASTASPGPSPDHYASIWVQTGGPTVQARHGQTADQYQQTVNEMFAQGFRPICVNGYEVGGRDLYASIWEQTSGPAVQAHHGQTADQYQQTVNEMFAQGFRPTCVSGYTLGGQDLYASVWVQTGGPTVQAHHGQSADQYQQTVNEMFAQGFRPLCVSGYTGGGQDLYASIWEQTSGPAVQAHHGQTADQYQQTVNEMFAQGFRPLCVNGHAGAGGQDLYASIWEQTSGPAVQAHHGQSSGEYQQTVDAMFTQGFRPIWVSGY